MTKEQRQELDRLIQNVKMLTLEESAYQSYRVYDPSLRNELEAAELKLVEFLDRLTV